MKKPYSKPQIAFESFTLSQSIAAGCSFVSNHVYETCGITIEDGFVIFTDASHGCVYTAPPGMGDRICYDVPSDDSRVFSS